MDAITTPQPPRKAKKVKSRLLMKPHIPSLFFHFHGAFLGKQLFDTKENRTIKKTYVFWRDPYFAINMAKQYLQSGTVPSRYEVVDNQNTEFVELKNAS